MRISNLVPAAAVLATKFAVQPEVTCLSANDMISNVGCIDYQSLSSFGRTYCGRTWSLPEAQMNYGPASAKTYGSWPTQGYCDYGFDRVSKACFGKAAGGKFRYAEANLEMEIRFCDY